MNTHNIAGRLCSLRKLFKKYDIDILWVPHSDEYNNEILPTENERLAYITGFKGSAGNAVISQDKAVLSVFGRDYFQALHEVDNKLFSVFNVNEKSFKNLLLEEAQALIAEAGNQKIKIGFYGFIHNLSEISSLQKFFSEQLSDSDIELVCLKDNPLDAIWHDRPLLKNTLSAFLYDEKYAGKSAKVKIQEAVSELEKANVYAAVITAQDSIAWLLNIRGNEVPYSPVVLSYLILNKNGRVNWIVEPDKISEDIKSSFADNVELINPADLQNELCKLSNKKILINKDTIPYAIYLYLQENYAEVVYGKDICELPKACKNYTEIAGIKQAHIHDGVAVVKFLKWFEETVKGGQKITEYDAARKLDYLRSEQPLYQQPSFATISAAGGNAAIAHYEISEDEADTILPEHKIYLFDSGGQYLNGTTDITRTVPVTDDFSNELGREIKRNYTLVLKGHIAIANTVFPKGTTGKQIDAFARRFLWQYGLDFQHSTGHGIGCFLNVHEGPQGISPKNDYEPLLPGMLLSNEPGYYKQGKYGIRIENVIIVKEVAIEGAESEMFGFETVSFAPIDLTLIDERLLSEEEKYWLNSYHSLVNKKISPHIDSETALWLEKKTKKI